MKIIDLLNKIANGEEVPKKVKYLNQVFELTNNKVDWYCYDYNINLLGNEIGLQQLNDTVEILEEEKKIPEKLEDINSDFYVNDCYYEKLSKEEIALDLVSLKNWINSIIDYLKNKGDE